MMKENNAQYIIGKEILVQINKIQENGIYCSFLPIEKRKIGFMPNYLMPTLFDKNGKFTKSVGDEISVVISKINDKGFIFLSDIKTYKRRNIKKFLSKNEEGTTIVEAEVSQILNSKIIITLDNNIQGVIKKEDTNWNTLNDLESSVFEGEIIKAVFLRYEKEQLYFSLKLLKEKPYDDSLYELSLLNLLKHIGHNSNEFIGQAKQNGNYLFIENLYSTDSNHEGKLLIDPLTGYNIKALVPTDEKLKVTENKFYKVKLILPPPINV
ncbi:MAG: hypothetical protein IJ180_09190 [Bacteroidales bacterium]|nr:hypothetical protein [Bacteroidales bacterium]